MKTRVYAIGWRHITPGEGVGGCEWNVSYHELYKRIGQLGILTDPAYETIERIYVFNTAAAYGDDTAREFITNEIDADLYEAADGWITNVERR